MSSWCFKQGVLSSAVLYLHVMQFLRDTAAVSSVFVFFLEILERSVRIYSAISVIFFHVFSHYVLES